jgi:hypothetical protein
LYFFPFIIPHPLGPACPLGPPHTGVFVRPRVYRAVLMDQDVAHRLSSPSVCAQRPRYSLVWKLAMTPRPQTATGQVTGPPRSPSPCIARKEWGPPTYFGSAAHVLRVAKQTAAAAAAAHNGGQGMVTPGPAAVAAAGVSDDLIVRPVEPGTAVLDTAQCSAKRRQL